MSILEVILLISLTMELLFGLGAVFFFFRMIQSKKQQKKIAIRKRGSKKKKKEGTQKRRQLMKQSKKSRQLSLLCTCLLFIFGGISAYVSHYQAMNLTMEDGNSVARGYYLVRDFEEQLILAKEGQIEEEQFRQQARQLATAMASYGIKQASTVNSEEGQLVLNRYYTAVQQLGMNASTQISHFYGNPELVETFLADIVRAKEWEQAVFDYYGVNESAFQEE